ncbi:MAG: phage holin family protein [Syntrophobacteraceae bacterium]
MQGDRTEKPVSELISDLYQREVALIRQEIELAKVEMSINARRAAKYTMFFVLGIGVFLAALVVLLHGIVIALIPFFAPVSSAVIVSFGAGGAGLLLMARK